jgi:hypothetical protein
MGISGMGDMAVAISIVACIAICQGKTAIHNNPVGIVKMLV